MYDHLLEQHGHKCQGCDWTFGDPCYPELDHDVSRADGGIVRITNRVPQCSLCNWTKRDIYALPGQRRLNNKSGWMAKDQ